MKFRSCVYGIASAVLLSSPALAAAPRSVDARTLDVAGVRVGMDINEAVKALAEHFGTSPADIKVERPSENLDTHIKIPDYVSYNKNGTKVVVYFEVRVPLDPAKPGVVTRIIYDVPSTPKNIAQMKKAVLAKYGPPSISFGSMMQWCARLSTKNGTNCPIDNARLEFHDIQIDLVDPAWEAALNKYAQEQRTVKPNL